MEEIKNQGWTNNKNKQLNKSHMFIKGLTLYFICDGMTNTYVIQEISHTLDEANANFVQ